MRLRRMKLPVLFGLLALTCARYENDNPFDPLYPRERYRFKVDWNAFPDTCYIQRDYIVGCTTSVGRDTFASFFGTITFPDSTYKFPAEKLRYDTFKVQFDREFDGDVAFIARQPNRKTWSDVRHLCIVNQFKPRLAKPSDSIETILGSKAFSLSVRDTLSTFFVIYVQSVSTSKIDSTKYSTAESDSAVRCLLKTGANDTVPEMVRVWIRNSAGLTSDTFPIKIYVVPYIPKIKSVFFPDTIACGERLRLAVKVDSNVSTFKVMVKSRTGRDSGVSAEYKNSNTPYSEVAINLLTKEQHDTGVVHWQVSIFDVERTKLSAPIEDSMYVDPLLPVLLFDAPTLELIPIEPQTIEVHAGKNKVKQYRWTVGEKGKSPEAFDTVTAVPFITRNFPNPLQTAVSVRGMNDFDFWGPVALLNVVVKNPVYLLHAGAPRFPTDIKAGDTARFEVSISDRGQFEAKKGKFYWRIDSADIPVALDSGFQKNSFARHFPDSGLFRINVVGRDSSGDSSNWIRKLVVVHRYAPICRFERQVDTVIIPIEKTDTLRLVVYDSRLDTNGHIDSVFWNIDGGKVFETVRYRESFLLLTDKNVGPVGSHKVKAYVKDNDGFTSPVDSMTLVVTSSVPYIGEPISDGGILVDQPISRRADFRVSNGQKPILRYYWRINDVLQADDTNILTTSFKSIGTNVIIVYCVNEDFAVSPKDTFLVHVYSEQKPVVTSIKPDTVWIMDDTAYTIAATSLKTGVPIIRYDVAWDATEGVTSYDTLSSPKRKYTAPGMHILKIIAVDRELQPSDTLLDSVWVRKAAPVTDSLSVDASVIFVNKKQNFTILSHDTNGTVDSAKIFWKPGDSSAILFRPAPSARTSTGHMFTLGDTGLRTLKIITRDNDGFWSDTLRHPVTIRLGKPVVRTVTMDTAITIIERHPFVIKANDSAGTVDSFFISFDGGTRYNASTDSTFDTAFHAAGRIPLVAYVKNSRGLVSDIYKDSVTVFSHRSTISSVKISLNKSTDSVFINAATKFTVTASDSIGTIKRVAFAWKGNPPFSDSTDASMGVVNQTYTFNPPDTAVRRILIRVVNDRSQVRDTEYPIRIRLGRPVVDSITPVSMFVNDTVNFKVLARDTNGNIGNYYFNFGDDTLWVKSTSAFPIKHKYAVSKAGAITVRSFVQDEDNLFSDTLSRTVTVRLGKPWTKRIPSNDTMVWNDTVPSDDDTLTCPYRSGPPAITTVAVAIGDTNGTVKKVYWGFYDNATLVTSTTTDKPILDITTLTKDVVYKLKVCCMDDDSIWSDTLQFNIMPHTPPPPVDPGFNFENKRLFWSGKDPADLDSTQYKVVFKKSGGDSIKAADENGCPTCTVVGFKTGFDSGHVGSLDFDWSYQVIPLLNPGSYLYKIYMRNSRSQISRNKGTPSLSF